MGNLSFHSQHKDGFYTDHVGSSIVADNHADVTIHHQTGSFAGGLYDAHALSQNGMDAVIYKVTEAGVPVKVFGVDVLPADGVFADLNSNEGGSVNGRFGGIAEFYAIDTFAGEEDMVVASGMFRGKLMFPMDDGTEQVLTNNKAEDREGRVTAPHFYWGGVNSFVAKVNMATGKTIWATDAGLIVGDGKRAYTKSVAATAAGHVITTFDERDADGAYQGKVVKFDGSDGTKVWEVAYDSVYGPYGLAIESDPSDEVAYISGTLKGTDVDPFVTGSPLTSSRGDALVAALDVSAASGPVAKWIVQIGQGGGSSVKAHGDHVYAAGTISPGTITIGTCTLSGAQGGYLIKLNKADGTCVWAKDTPFGRGTAVTDGASVWTFNSDSGKVKYNAEHTIYSNAKSGDVFVAKFDAADGTGQWATAIGGSGDDRLAGRGSSGATITPSGPVFVGSTKSESISVGTLTIDHLQVKRAEELGLAGPSWGPNSRGETALFSMLISTTDELPPCISSCPTGEVSAADTTIASGKCYAYTECLADGASSSPFPCFQCDATAEQKVLSGQGATPPVPDENHCYIDNECIPTGETAPNYQTRNKASVCEWCDPTLNPNDWSLKSGFVHDRTFAQEIEDGQKGGRWGRRLQDGEVGQANSFGMLFEKQSNGCQILPVDMTMPASPSEDLTAALVDAASGTIAAVSALTSGAIAAVSSATNTNQHVHIAWAHYSGNSVTCTKSGDVCQHTPAAFADTIGDNFDTNLHYGHSVARVKVQQGLTVLKETLASSSSEAALIADLKKDIIAHMLVPYYQAAVKSAYHMDAGADAAAKATARAEGKEYWQVVNDAVGSDFNAADSDFLTSMFASAAAGDFNYCATSTRLLSKLPAASQLQYTNLVRAGTMTTTAAESIVHVTAADMGTLQESLVGGEPKKCTMPPNPPPPSPNSPPPPVASPAPPSGPVVTSTSNSLSSGEVAGIAVGAVAGGLLLLLVLGLVLRTVLFKEAKPIFTCLEKNDVEKAQKPATKTDP